MEIGGNTKAKEKDMPISQHNGTGVTKVITSSANLPTTSAKAVVITRTTGKMPTTRGKVIIPTTEGHKKASLTPRTKVLGIRARERVKKDMLSIVVETRQSMVEVGEKVNRRILPAHGRMRKIHQVLMIAEGVWVPSGERDPQTV